MALERKDLRLKVDPDLLEKIRVIADVENKEIGELCESILETQISALVDRAMVIAEKLQRQGLTGKNGE